jgi:hypothetical protein
MRAARRLLVLILAVGALSGGWALLDDPIEPPVAPLRVEVINGCGEPRLAARAARRLRQLGQDVRDERNAQRSDHERSVLIDRRGRPQLTRRLARALGGVPVILERSEGSTVDASLLLGRDHGRFELLAPADAAER